MGTAALTFRDGLLAEGAVAGDDCVGFLAAEDIVLGDGRASLAAFAAESRFSWELGGSSTSLLGTGVESLTEGLADLANLGLGLGRELAFVVSCRQEGLRGSGETFTLDGGAEDRGEDATAGLRSLARPPDAAGEDFWKKDTMERCLPAEDADAVLGLADAVELEAPAPVGLAGVRAAPDAAFLSPGMVTRLRVNQTRRWRLRATSDEQEPG